MGLRVWAWVGVVGTRGDTLAPRRRDRPGPRREGRRDPPALSGGQRGRGGGGGGRGGGGGGGGVATKRLASGQMMRSSLVASCRGDLSKTHLRAISSAICWFAAADDKLRSALAIRDRPAAAPAAPAGRSGGGAVRDGGAARARLHILSRSMLVRRETCQIMASGSRSQLLALPGSPSLVQILALSPPALLLALQLLLLPATAPSLPSYRPHPRACAPAGSWRCARAEPGGGVWGGQLTLPRGHLRSPGYLAAGPKRTPSPRML